MNKEDFYDGLYREWKSALKAKDAEKAVYYRMAMASPTVAVASFDKQFKNSWAHGEWVKKYAKEIETQKTEFKRFAYLGESTIMKKSELRQLIAEAVAEVMAEANQPTGVPGAKIMSLDQFVKTAQVDEDVSAMPPDTSKPLYIIDVENMWVRDDVADKILHLPETKFSAGGKADAFRVGDFAYFTETKFSFKENPSKYKADLALRKYSATPRHPGYSFAIAAVCGSWGFGFTWMYTKHLFSKRLKKLMFDAAAKFIDGMKKELSEADMLGAKTTAMSPDEMQAFLGRTKEKALAPAEKYKMPYVHGSNIAITNDAGQKYDTDKLKAAIMRRPAQILKMNAKMAKSGGENSIFFDIGLPALKGLAVNEKTGEFIIVDTCPGAGACKVYCYAKKGGYIQYKDASMSQTRLLNYLLNDPQGFKKQFETELTKEAAKAKSKGKTAIIRWHDAGDFFSPEYLELAYSIARNFPEVKFYAYTKMAGVAMGKKPDNFIMNFSMGATPEQEKQIDFATTKHSTVVPKPMFDQYMLKDEKGKLVRDEKNRMQFKDEASLDEFKKKLAQKYNVKPDSVITYDEMLKTAPSSEKNKYNVIIRPGDGDVSASRADVKGTYLLIH